MSTSKSNRISLLKPGAPAEDEADAGGEPGEASQATYRGDDSPDAALLELGNIALTGVRTRISATRALVSLEPVMDELRRLAMRDLDAAQASLANAEMAARRHVLAQQSAYSVAGAFERAVATGVIPPTGDVLEQNAAAVDNAIARAVGSTMGVWAVSVSDVDEPIRTGAFSAFTDALADARVQPAGETAPFDWARVPLARAATPSPVRGDGSTPPIPTAPQDLVRGDVLDWDGSPRTVADVVCTVTGVVVKFEDGTRANLPVRADGTLPFFSRYRVSSSASNGTIVPGREIAS